MARSPSSKRWLDTQFESVHHQQEVTTSSRIIKERRQRDNERSIGLSSKLGNPRLESHGAESVGHYRWRSKAKNLSPKTHNRNGETLAPRQHRFIFNEPIKLPGETEYVPATLPEPTKVATKRYTSAELADIHKRYSQR